MPELDDLALLRQYAEGNSESAFSTLAEKYVNLVYSTALRGIGSPHAAEDITQAVFIILARKANKLPRHAVLSGWLYQTTRLTAANFLRGDISPAKTRTGGVYAISFERTGAEGLAAHHSAAG